MSCGNLFHNLFQALQSLFDGEFDVPKTVELLHAARRQRFTARRELDTRLPSEAFKDAVATHGKKFHLVKQALGENVATREIVSKYYLWKRTDDFKEWRRLHAAKKVKKSKKEVERLRQWMGENDPETETYLSYHNKRCELCATGGSLLCCDGCARAYHISCAQPPITKVPDENWYCLHCQDAFGEPTPKLVPSEENPYCLQCPPFPGVPRSLIECMTDASSYEGEQDCSGDELEDSVSSQFVDGSDNDGNVSDCPSTDYLSSNAGNGSLTDNESDSTSTKIRPSSARNPGSVAHSPDIKQEGEAEIHPPVSSVPPMVQTAESFSTGVRRTPVVQLEKLSSRKRHRKMLAPRRIPPSRFDS
ncbi:Chromodomain-helicase-DNA-binding protein 4 [Phytophthora citrophthora]|uniref:Chromodomain-helicase-DNA-binding protein 4 n=1 Tax=Phytophthora citrophthora TaxID=4793 RepID=A0AAD9GZH7_9STRA|nr:Chromodomain-helicase-DNA-binding protein 4 [Phytophthora citrophthora]